MSSRRILQDFFKTSWRGLEEVLEDEQLLRQRRLEDISWRRLENFLEINKMFTRISVLNNGLRTNLNQCLTNLCLTNLYLTNLRRVQNALIEPHSFYIVLFWNSSSRIISRLTLQNRWGNKNEVLSNILHKYIEWLFILIFIFNLHLKNIFIFKKSSRFAYLLKEKPGNWFAIVKKWRRKAFKEKYLHLYLKFDSGTIFSFCLWKSSNWFLRKLIIDSKWIIPND